MYHDRVFNIHFENAQLTERGQDLARQVDSDELHSLGRNFKFSAYRDWLNAFYGDRIKLLKALR